MLQKKLRFWKKADIISYAARNFKLLKNFMRKILVVENQSYRKKADIAVLAKLLEN